MTTIEIRVVQNGYIAHEGLSKENPLGVGPAYVFESWGHLIEWVRENLDKPLEGAQLPESGLARLIKERMAE